MPASATPAVATDATPTEPTTVPPPLPRWRRSAMVQAAALAGAASTGPSLVPRTWLGQGITTAVSVLGGLLLGWIVATGLTVGVVALNRVRQATTPGQMRQPLLARRTRVVLQRVGWVVTIAGVGLLLAWGRQGRIATARLVGLAPPSLTEDTKAALTALGLVAGIAGMVGLIWGLWRLLGRGLGRGWVGRLVAAVAVGLTVLALVQWVGVPAVINAMRASSTARDAQNPPDASAPTSSLRSGGPGSTQPWSALGYEGRRFVSGGPTPQRITEVTGTPAQEPIRAYAGMGSGRHLDQTVETAMAELRRTGAFSRGTLLVVTPTGRGWIDEFIVASVEYLTSGDCATVGIQYSNDPSWVAFAGSREAPQQAGRLLFERIEHERSLLPATARPRLLVAGLSLGAFGGQAPFSTPQDMLRRVDGALWIGTPRFTPLRSQLTDQRQPGSTELLPEVDTGRHIRFAATPEQLGIRADGSAYGPWETPRVAYLQHASDPVVWWHPQLLVRQPDWMREDVGADVNPGLRWIPLLSYWQTTMDVVMGAKPEPTSTGGHGHLYREEVSHAWAAILGQPPERAAAIAAAV